MINIFDLDLKKMVNSLGYDSSSYHCEDDPRLFPNRFTRQGSEFAENNIPLPDVYGWGPCPVDVSQDDVASLLQNYTIAPGYAQFLVIPSLTDLTINVTLPNGVPDSARWRNLGWPSLAVDVCTAGSLTNYAYPFILSSTDVNQVVFLFPRGAELVITGTDPYSLGPKGQFVFCKRLTWPAPNISDGIKYPCMIAAFTSDYYVGQICVPPASPANDLNRYAPPYFATIQVYRDVSRSLKARFGVLYKDSYTSDSFPVPSLFSCFVPLAERIPYLNFNPGSDLDPAGQDYVDPVPVGNISWLRPDIQFFGKRLSHRGGENTDVYSEDFITIT